MTEAWRLKLQVETQKAGIEEIFREIETAFALDVILKVPVPLACFPQLNSVVGQMKRRQSLIRSDGRQPRPLLYRSIDRTVFVSRAVVVAEGDQRPALPAASS